MACPRSTGERRQEGKRRGWIRKERKEKRTQQQWQQQTFLGRKHLDSWFFYKLMIYVKYLANVLIGCLAVTLAFIMNIFHADVSLKDQLNIWFIYNKSIDESIKVYFAKYLFASYLAVNTSLVLEPFISPNQRKRSIICDLEKPEDGSGLIWICSIVF